MEQESEMKKEKQRCALRLCAKIIGILLLAAVLLTALYIMANGLGLVEGMDFGAGAYFYADIPNFEKYVNGDHFHSQTPMWVLILLFLLWGGIMYRFWTWIDKKIN